MTTSFIPLALSLSIPIILYFVAFTLASRSLHTREKATPFECGFDPMKSARQPFSLRFFLLAVIFIVFDIEIVLLLPIPLNSSNPMISMGALLFTLILILGLLHEWNEGSLNWETPKTQ